MDRLTKPKSGEYVTAAWASEVVDEIRRQSIIPGNGLKKTVTSTGTVLDLDPSKAKGGGKAEAPLSDVVPCITKTVPTTATEGYEVDLYANGLAADPTDTGILYLPEISAHTKLPAGTCILAHVCEATYTQSDARGDVIGG